MKLSMRHVLLLPALLLSSTMVARAQDSACAAKIRECFSLSDAQRDLCFQATSRTAVCRDTHDGALAAQRGAYSSMLTPEALEDGSGTLSEPLLFDKECVENFDNLWLSHMVNDSHSPETCEYLLEALKECSKQPSFDLLRP